MVPLLDLLELCTLEHRLGRTETEDSDQVSMFCKPIEWLRKCMEKDSNVNDSGGYGGIR